MCTIAAAYVALSIDEWSSIRARNACSNYGRRAEDACWANSVMARKLLARWASSSSLDIDTSVTRPWRLPLPLYKP
jgi:hypothetical protein